MPNDWPQTWSGAEKLTLEGLELIRSNSCGFEEDIAPETPFALCLAVLTGPILNDGIGAFGANASQVTAGAVEFACVDEQHLFAVVAEAAFGVGVFAFREEPEADGNLRAVEELAGEGDHAVHEVGLDEGAADVSFAGLVGGHAAVGEDEADHALRGEVVDEVLHPGEVGVALGLDAELMNTAAFTLRATFGFPCRSAPLPAYIVVLAEPVGVVEGRVGQQVVGSVVVFQGLESDDEARFDGVLPHDGAGAVWQIVVAEICRRHIEKTEQVGRLFRNRITNGALGIVMIRRKVASFFIVEIEAKNPSARVRRAGVGRGIRLRGLVVGRQGRSRLGRG